jgi:hypothetical protein
MISPLRLLRERNSMRLVPARTALVVAVSVAVVALGTACGGSDDGPDSVSGCEIQAGTSCPGADLSGADLSGADLSRAVLSDANLEGTNLSGADLDEAKLDGARLVDTDLSDADLTGATLEGATISGTNLDGATLCGTIRTDGMTDDSSCPASTETTGTTGTTDSGAQAAEITSFTVGELVCPAGGGDGTVPVTWATDASTAVRLEVDGAEADNAGPNGSADVSVPCDGADHEVSVVPLSDAGAGQPETETVSSG